MHRHTTHWSAAGHLHLGAALTAVLHGAQHIVAVLEADLRTRTIPDRDTGAGA
jgi:hypothetical protein